MSFVAGSFVFGIAMGVFAGNVARTLLLMWFAVIAVLLAPSLLMPSESSALLWGSAALTILALPLSLALGWGAGRGGARVLRNAP